MIFMIADKAELRTRRRERAAWGWRSALGLSQFDNSVVASLHRRLLFNRFDLGAGPSVAGQLCLDMDAKRQAIHS